MTEQVCPTCGSDDPAKDWFIATGEDGETVVHINPSSPGQAVDLTEWTHCPDPFHKPEAEGESSPGAVTLWRFKHERYWRNVNHEAYRDHPDAEFRTFVPAALLEEAEARLASAEDELARYRPLWDGSAAEQDRDRATKAESLLEGRTRALEEIIEMDQLKPSEMVDRAREALREAGEGEDR